MSQELMICGPSGSGKSTSLRNLDPAKTFIVNCGKKPLPFPGSRKNYSQLSKDNPQGNMLNSNKFEDIASSIKYVAEKRPEIQFLIIDDFQFSLAAHVLSRIADKGFDKFNALAKGVWDVVELSKNQRDDLNVVFISHTDTNYNSEGIKETKAKTLGKMLDNTVNLDGLFTVILYSEANKSDDGIQYKFRTSTSGTDTCKSPMGMFEEEYIDNDLDLVFSQINKYYEG